VVQDPEQVADQRRGPVGERPAEGVGLGLPADRRAGQERFDARVRREYIPDEVVELVADVVRLPGLPGGGEQGFGVHPGQRRNHIKGTCAAGEFIGTPDAVALSRSTLFSGKTIPVVARFSLGGGNPDVPDAAPAPRGMALEFHLPGGALQHITMINVPIFAAASPASFRDALLAAKPDPKTGQPDPEKLKAYAATHPDALALTELTSHHSPTANYYQTTFFSIHTFKFIDAKGTEHLVKWRFVPGDGTKEMTAAEMQAAPHDFLEKNLIERTRKGPVLWDMIVYVGEPGDPQDNPTLAWPETASISRPAP